MAIPTLTDFTQYRGNFTKISAGGVPLSAIMLASDGGSTITSWSVVQISPAAVHWTTANGTQSPVPNSSGDGANLNQGPYTFTVTATNADGPSDAKTLIINILANKFTVSSPNDVSGTGTRSLKQSRSLLGGNAVQVARGSDAAWNCSGGVAYDTTHSLSCKDWNIHTAGTRITIENEDDNNPALIGQLSINGGTRIDVVNLRFSGFLSAANTVPNNQELCFVTVAYGTGSSDMTFTGLSGGAPITATSRVQWICAMEFAGVTTTAPYPMLDGITVSNCDWLRVKSGILPRTVSNFWAHHNTVDSFLSNAWFLAGAQNLNVLFEDNVSGRPFQNPIETGDHPDQLQSGSSTARGNYTNITYRRNMLIYANGDFRAQGPFFNDLLGASGGPYYFNNVTIENNFYDGIALQGIFMDCGTGWVIQRNTLIRGDGRTSIDGRWENTGIRQQQVAPLIGTVTQNVLWVVSQFMDPAVYDAATNLDVTGTWALPGTITTVAPCSSAIAAYYATHNLFVDPDVSGINYAALTIQEIADLLRLHYAAKAAGSAMNTGGADGPAGTYKSCFFPDGTYNDGTVYQATPPSLITSSAQLDAIVIGQPDTITFQLDAPANLAVTVTPAVGVVTGSFSPTTVVIGVGEASGTTDFTPATAGAASITATNNRSLTNPAALPVTVTSPVNPPVSYTQALSVNAYTPYPTAITVTYVLNVVATEDVTITPACTLAGSFTTGATVVIAFGTQVGTATFLPATYGPAIFTATNDHSLANPSPAATTVTSTNLANMLVLGVRPHA